MSVSVSTHSCDADAVEELCRRFAAGNVALILAELASVRDALTRAEPDTVYTFFQDNLPEILQHAKQPYTLLLDLLEQSELKRQPHQRVDLMVLLIRALIRNRHTENEADEEEESEAAAASSSTPALPAEVTPALIARAHALCTRGSYLTPRAFEALVRCFRLTLTEEELLSYATTTFGLRQYRDTAEFLRTFHLESDSFPHDLLLQHLVDERSNMDVFSAYLTMSPEFLKKHVKQALTHLAEYGRPEQNAKHSSATASSSAASATLTAPSGHAPLVGGNDPNLAAKLALRFGFSLKEFPRVVALKLGDCLWWITRINKSREFGMLICSREVYLQKKLVRELMKSRNVNDNIIGASFLEIWPHLMQEESGMKDYELKHMQEFCLFYERMKTVWENVEQKKLWAEQENKFEEQLKRAMEIEKEIGGGEAAVVADASAADASSSSTILSTASLLLPSLPPSPTSTIQLPQLFLRPSSIVFVDSLATLAIANEHLLEDETTDIIGIDLEHLPENLDGLEIKPSLTQLLQISCKKKVFLIDLQVLYWKEEDEEKKSEATSSSSAQPQQLPNTIFPPIPPYRPVCTPTSRELKQGVCDLLLALFLNSDLLKVGIGFSQDLRKMRNDFPELVPFQCTLQNYIDLTPLLKLVPDPDERNDGAGGKRKKESGGRAARRRQSAKAKGMSRDVNANGAAAAASTSSTASNGGSIGGDADAVDAPNSEPSPPLESASVASSSSAAAASSSSGNDFTRAPHGGYSHAAKKEGGLLKLVRMMLRRHLDKSEQISNWSNRPLTQPQQQYAALDAYACILIHEEAVRRGIDCEAENIEATN